MIANLKHAIRNRESITIGGGAFSPDEIRAHLDTHEALLEALCDALPYVEDVMANSEQLACFKPGVVQAHAKAIRAAIERATK